jgi:serine/threonine-protein kinase RsbW
MPVATKADGDVTIAIARDPALVRTVRLVAAAVARRADCSDTRIEEIRLAVGEACAVMIGQSETGHESEDRVKVRLQTDHAFTITVTGRLADDESGFAEIGLDPWALLEGLSEELKVSENDGVTNLSLTWPL